MSTSINMKFLNEQRAFGSPFDLGFCRVIVVGSRDLCIGFVNVMRPEIIGH
jgi:hypothetical protein